MSAPVLVTADVLRGWPLPRPGSEKHRRGVVLVIGGSASTPGAPRLAGEAALRAGAGQLKVATAASIAAALGAAVPEARVDGFTETGSGDLAAGDARAIGELADEVDAVLIGPGFVEPDDVEALLTDLMPLIGAPVVLDALVSAFVGQHPDQVAAHDTGCVITLNPSELGHALGIDASEVEQDPDGAVRRLVERTAAVVVCGGETKVIGSPDGRLHVVTAGGPGLAVSGSGDVQAGIIAGLLARGATSDQAAVWGAWLHATAGEQLAARVGPLGFLARELAVEVPTLLGALAHDRQQQP